MAQMSKSEANTKLVYAAEAGDLGELKTAIAGGANVNAFDGAALRYARLGRHKGKDYDAISAELIKAGADTALGQRAKTMADTA